MKFLIRYAKLAALVWLVFIVWLVFSCARVHGQVPPPIVRNIIDTNYDGPMSAPPGPFLTTNGGRWVWTFNGSLLTGVVAASTGGVSVATFPGSGLLNNTNGQVITQSVDTNNLGIQSTNLIGQIPAANLLPLVPNALDTNAGPVLDAKHLTVTNFDLLGGTNLMLQNADGSFLNMTRGSISSFAGGSQTALLTMLANTPSPAFFGFINTNLGNGATARLFLGTSTNVAISAGAIIYRQTGLSGSTTTLPGSLTLLTDSTSGTNGIILEAQGGPVRVVTGGFAFANTRLWVDIAGTISASNNANIGYAGAPAPGIDTLEVNGTISGNLQPAGVPNPLWTNTAITHYLWTNALTGTYGAWVPGVGLVESNAITGTHSLLVGTNGGFNSGDWAMAGAGNILASNNITATKTVQAGTIVITNPASTAATAMVGMIAGGTLVTNPVPSFSQTNQTITLSSDVTGSGTTAISVTVTNVRGTLTNAVTGPASNATGGSVTQGLASASVTVTVAGTANQITSSVATAQPLSGNVATTLSVPNDFRVPSQLTVTSGQTNSNLTASQFVSTDANKALTSTLNGNALTNLNGTNLVGTITNPVNCVYFIPTVLSLSGVTNLLIDPANGNLQAVTLTTNVWICSPPGNVNYVESIRLDLLTTNYSISFFTTNITAVPTLTANATNAVVLLFDKPYKGTNWTIVQLGK